MPKSEIKDTISDSNWSKHIESPQSVKDVIGTKQNITTALKNSIIKEFK